MRSFQTSHGTTDRSVAAWIVRRLTGRALEIDVHPRRAGRFRTTVR